MEVSGQVGHCPYLRFLMRFESEVGRFEQAGQTRGLQNCMLWPAHDVETFTVSDLEVITGLCCCLTY
jgi:hypothetical protein